MTGFEGDVCLVDKCNTCIKDNNKKNWIDILDDEYFLSYFLRDFLEKVVEFSNYFASIIAEPFISYFCTIAVLC